MDYKRLFEDNKSNTEMLKRIVSEVNSWDDSLESYRVYEFDDDFFETFFEGKPQEAARATFFGDIQNWMDEYIRFNGYGNLESLSQYRYDEELNDGADEIIRAALDNIDNIDMDYITGDLNTEGYEAEEGATA